MYQLRAPSYVVFPQHTCWADGQTCTFFLSPSVVAPHLLRIIHVLRTLRGLGFTVACALVYQQEQRCQTQPQKHASHWPGGIMYSQTNMIYINKRYSNSSCDPEIGYFSTHLSVVTVVGSKTTLTVSRCCNSTQVIFPSQWHSLSNWNCDLQKSVFSVLTVESPCLLRCSVNTFYNSKPKWLGLTLTGG